MIQVSGHMFAIHYHHQSSSLGLSDTENTMSAMLIPRLLSLHKHGSANDAGADTLELYSSSSASDGEMFGHQKRVPKEKKP